MEGTEGSRPEPQHGSWSTRFRSLIGLIGREREKPPAASLADYLLQAAGKEPYALETQPEAFNLGEIGHEAEKLMQLTLKHPRRIEYGTLVFVDGLAKTKRKEYGSELRKLGVPTRKVQGVTKDENNSLTRLADAVAGFVRDVLEKEGEDMEKLFKEATKNESLIEV